MRHLVLSLLLLLVLLLPISACMEQEPAPPVSGGYDGPITTIIVHHYRFDQDYTDWDLWVWPQYKEGKGFAFTHQDSYGVIAQVILKGEFRTVALFPPSTLTRLMFPNNISLPYRSGLETASLFI
jgi:pullulanase